MHRSTFKISDNDLKFLIEPFIHGDLMSAYTGTPGLLQSPVAWDVAIV